MSNVQIRSAHVGDCQSIATLFLISSDGLAAYIWEQGREPNKSLDQVGARRYARTGVDFSFENCLIADLDGEVCGMAHSYVMRVSNGPTDDPVLRPYSELEEPGSLYLSGIALFQSYRGNGIGSQLLDATHERASDLECNRVSLICMDQNVGAMRLYERNGYREAARRPIVPHPTLKYTHGDAVLMVRSAD